MAETVSKKKLCDGDSGRTCTIYNNPTCFLFLTGYFQRIDDAGKDNNGSSMLVIVKYRDIKKFF